MDAKLTAELEEIKRLKIVLSARKKVPEVLPVFDKINVGVAFRTDGKGKAHVGHDMMAIKNLNNLKDNEGNARFPFRIEPIVLPRNAEGSETPRREATFRDLDDIQLLYIPGGPTANDTQEASSPFGHKYYEIERNLNRAKNARERGEHVSRATYELRLLGIARARGIPILAVCGGSWRLLESYGGKVRTLEISQRERHKAQNRDETWSLHHDLQLMGGRTLIKLMEQKRIQFERNQKVNSTHWAVASTVTDPYTGLKLARGTDDPSHWLEITAIEPDTDTVEAFESLYGAPTMGIQWHPESYLPEMPGSKSGTDDVRALSIAIFELMAFAAQTAKRRQSISASLSFEVRAFEALCKFAKAVARDQKMDAALAYEQAEGLLPRAYWSARMIAVDEASSLIFQGREAWVRKRPGKALLLYHEARKRLSDYGVMI